MQSLYMQQFPEAQTVCFIFLQFFPHAAITVFTKDAALIRAGTLYLHSFSIDCMLVCVVFCLTGFFNGCGHTTFSMFNNVLAAFLIRVPATWLFSRLPPPGPDMLAHRRPIPACSTMLWTASIRRWSAATLLRERQPRARLCPDRAGSAPAIRIQAVAPMAMAPTAEKMNCQVSEGMACFAIP